MALHDAPRFARRLFDPPAHTLTTILRGHARVLNATPWLHCGYASLAPVRGLHAPSMNVVSDVTNQFGLAAEHGFERTPLLVTTGVRGSRFAPVVFWEALHALAPGGTWIDVDDASARPATDLAGEILERDYFARCLQPVSTREHGRLVVRTFSKHASAPLAATIDDDGWTFGILTAGASPRAAQMVRAILALGLPRVEVIICGPKPDGLPRDERIRVIDLGTPESRGWITRKKNLIADTARYENLCILHDRYVITPEWADALTGYGPLFSFLTFPQHYVIDEDGRFTQRYADYQLVRQARGVRASLDAKVYPGERVFYAPYDDFSETAFCCGGLYIAKRSLWNEVKQDESLFHCEWEDVSFGLDCQRRGLPHRVNTLLTAESMTPHPMALTRIHNLMDDQPVHGWRWVSDAQEAAAAAALSRFKPVLGTTREAYVAKIVDRFNAMPIVSDGSRITASDVRSIGRPSGLWRLVQDRVADLAPTTRAEIAAVMAFLSDAVYNWPNCEIQSRIAAHERALDAAGRFDGYEALVGWGTGSMFASARRFLPRDLTFAVDSNPARWEQQVDGVRVLPPDALRSLPPESTAVVIFSCYGREIRAAIEALGPFHVFDAAEVVASRRFAAVADLVAYYDEVERYYPVLFQEKALEAAAA